MTAGSAITASGLLQSDPLCGTFVAMAQKIWTDLGRARMLGINRGEETITDNFLLDVQSAHPAEVATFQFTKPEESVTGADWEWWLTNGREWVGLLIQAKILKAKANLYSSIKHKVRGRPQIDILLGPVDKVDSQISGSVIQDCLLGGSFGSRRPDRYGMADHRGVVAHRARQEVPAVAR